MNAKKLVILAVALGLFAISTANVQAQTHRNAGFAPRAGTSHSFAGTRTGNWGSGNWNGNWHHHHNGGSTVFIGGFGFPFFGFGYPYGYGYGGYPYGGYYPSPYYGGYYGGGGYYNSGYYGNGYYGGGYSGTGYASYSYGSGYRGQSSVVRLQQQLARAGYYRGAIDGIMGSRTRYALRAYQHDRGGGGYGMTNQ